MVCKAFSLCKNRIVVGLSPPMHRWRVFARLAAYFCMLGVCCGVRSTKAGRPSFLVLLPPLPDQRARKLRSGIAPDGHTSGYDHLTQVQCERITLRKRDLPVAGDQSVAVTSEGLEEIS